MRSHPPVLGRPVYVHADHQGSTIATTDGSGEVVETYAYDPYGNAANDNTGFPFRFTGQRFDAETGLYYYKALRKGISSRCIIRL